MTRQISLLIRSLVVTSALSLAAMPAYGDGDPSWTGPYRHHGRSSLYVIFHGLPDDFGAAMYPPAQWPNLNEPGLGGRPLIVPYYPGYHRPRNKGLFRHGIDGGCAFGGPDVNMWPVAGVPSGDYGGYTGASNDEEFLLHLGGNGPFRRFNNAPDIIDLIQGFVPNGNGNGIHP